jgi:hypothetical protein
MPPIFPRDRHRHGGGRRLRREREQISAWQTKEPTGDHTADDRGDGTNKQGRNQ